MGWIKIKTSTELVRVLPEDIVFVQADGNYSDLYLVNGVPHTMTFKLHFFDEQFRLLENNTFVRVGKSLIVNKDYINVVNLTNQELLLSGSRLKNDFRVKASREALKELKSLLEGEQS